MLTMSLWYNSLASSSCFYFSLGKSSLCPAVEPAHFWPMGNSVALKQRGGGGGGGGANASCDLTLGRAHAISKIFKQTLPARLWYCIAKAKAIIKYLMYIFLTILNPWRNAYISNFNYSKKSFYINIIWQQNLSCYLRSDVWNIEKEEDDEGYGASHGHLIRTTFSNMKVDCYASWGQHRSEGISLCVCVCVSSMVIIS